MVMLQERLGHLASRLFGGGLVASDALRLVGSNQAFDVTLPIWPPRRAHVRLDSDAEEEADQGGGEITPAGAAHPSRVMVKRQLANQPRAAQAGNDGGQRRLRVKVRGDLGVDDVPTADVLEQQRLYRVLPQAVVGLAARCRCR
jgi:hypothetical protein